MDEKILDAIEAYVCKCWSHRDIQKRILKIDAPSRGGGFRAMSLLHGFGITEEYKGILAGRGFNRKLFSAVYNIRKYLEVINSEDPQKTLKSIMDRNKPLVCQEAENYIHVKMEEVASFCKANNICLNYSLSSLIEFKDKLKEYYCGPDDITENIFAGCWEEADLRKAIKLLGSYFGESVRIKSGGQWQVGRNSGIRYLSHTGNKKRTIYPFAEAETILKDFSFFGCVLSERYYSCSED